METIIKRLALLVMLFLVAGCDFWEKEQKDPEYLTPKIELSRNEYLVYPVELNHKTRIYIDVRDFNKNGSITASVNNAATEILTVPARTRVIIDVLPDKDFGTEQTLTISVENDNKHKSSVSVKLKMTSISVTADEMAFSNKGGSGVIKVQSSVPYKVVSNINWATVSQDATKDTWIITAKANTIKETVTGTITVKDSCGVYKINVPISLEAATVTPSEQAEIDAVVAIFRKLYKGTPYEDMSGKTLDEIYQSGVRTINGERHLVELSIKLGYPANPQENMEVPEEVGAFKYLKYLEISGTHELQYGTFIGELPESIKNLTDLKEFHVTNTGISGNLPDFIGEFKNLKWLNVHNNYFTGNLPLWLNDMPNLETFHFALNCFDGKIDESLTKTKWWNTPCEGPEEWVGQPMGLAVLSLGQKEGHALYL